MHVSPALTPFALPVSLVIAPTQSNPCRPADGPNAGTGTCRMVATVWYRSEGSDPQDWKRQVLRRRYQTPTNAFYAWAARWVLDGGPGFVSFGPLSYREVPEILP